MDAHSSLIREEGNICTEKFEKLKACLSSELAQKITRPTITLEDVVGLKEVKTTIFQQLNNNLEEHDRILLFGATGTGKSYLVEAIANKLDANLITFIIDDTVLHKWAANMAVYTKAIYQLCQERGGLHTILFFDFLDCFALVDEKGGRRWNLIRFIQEVQLAWKKVQQVEHESETYRKLIIFAATYQPKWLDENLVHCFHQRIYVPILNSQERKELFQRKIQYMWKIGGLMQPNDMDKLVRMTHGILTSEIGKMVCKAKKLQLDKHWPQIIKLENLERKRVFYDNFEWRAPVLADFKRVFEPFLLPNRKIFYELKTFQRKFGTRSFMTISRRDGDDASVKLRKTNNKNGWAWKVFSWICNNV